MPRVPSVVQRESLSIRIQPCIRQLTQVFDKAKELNARVILQGDRKQRDGPCSMHPMPSRSWRTWSG